MAEKPLRRFIPGKRSFFINSMPAMTIIETTKTIARGLNPRICPYQTPAAATTSENPYLMIFCQV
jgi:hypothetical protein